MDPWRNQKDWTFTDVVLELHSRFVHQATVQLATEKYKRVTYELSTGVAGLIAEMTKYAHQMVERPGEYAFKQKFMKELPTSISATLMCTRHLTAEGTTLETLYREA
jgi:hypothetical protein